MNVLIDEPGIVCQFADSGYDAVQWIKATKAASWHYAGTGSDRPVEKTDWGSRMGTGGVDRPEAFRLVEEGWQEGVKKMHEGLQTLLALNSPGLERWKNDVAGEQPDIFRAIGGDPRCMRRRSFQKGNKPVIHIVVNTAMAAGATDTQTMNYGIAILGLIDFLESRGRRVELDRVGVVDGSRGRSLQGWKVKRAEETPDLAAIAFAIAHPASHRRIVWAMRERGINFRSHGSPAKVSRQDAERIGAPTAFILDSVGRDGGRCDTPLSALKLAAERLNEAAGEMLIDLEELAL